MNWFVIVFGFQFVQNVGRFRAQGSNFLGIEAMVLVGLHTVPKELFFSFLVRVQPRWVVDAVGDAYSTIFVQIGAMQHRGVVPPATVVDGIHLHPRFHRRVETGGDVRFLALCSSPTAAARFRFGFVRGNASIVPASLHVVGVVRFSLEMQFQQHFTTTTPR